MREPNRSISPDADNPFDGWTDKEAEIFWSARNSRNARIRNSVRKALIGQGAKKSLALDHKISQFIDEIEMAVEVAQWRNEYASQQSLRPLIKSLGQTIKYLRKEANQYVLSVTEESRLPLLPLVRTLSELRDHAANVETRNLSRGNVVRYVLPQIDAFFLKVTGERLTQSKKILIASSKTEHGKSTKEAHPAFAYALLRGVAPWISHSKIQTALKNYIIDRNRAEGITSNGRPKGSGKKRRA